MVELVDVKDLVPERRKLGVAAGYRERAAVLKRKAEVLEALLLHVHAEATSAERMADFLDMTFEDVGGKPEGWPGKA
jgi:hypothetical protein